MPETTDRRFAVRLTCDGFTWLDPFRFRSRLVAEAYREGALSHPSLPWLGWESRITSTDREPGRTEPGDHERRAIFLERSGFPLEIAEALEDGSIVVEPKGNEWRAAMPGESNAQVIRSCPIEAAREALRILHA